MRDTQQISEKRTRLLTEEKKLVSELEDETVALESSLKSSMKTLALIGAGVLTVAAVYHVFGSSSETEDGKNKGKQNKRIVKSSASPVTASVISLLLQKLLPLALERFSKDKGKDDQK